MLERMRLSIQHLRLPLVRHKKFALSLTVLIITLILGLSSISFADDIVVGGEPYKKIEKILYDDDIAANSKEYFGWALPGTLTSVSEWKIMRITYTGADFVVEFADGDANYDNEWDNRATTVVYE